MKQMPAESEGTKKFELPGSRAHYPPSLQFTINHMRLSLEVDFQEKTISCDQQLEITALQDTGKIELDATELQIKSVAANGSRLDFRSLDDKLIIKLARLLREGAHLTLAIKYRAKPRKGFYFVGPDDHYPKKNLQVWTQGETVESRYWFPCIDHPQVKFATKISITVPKGFTAISNGVLSKQQQSENKTTYVWSEENPHPAYLTSVVIGKFVEIKENQMIYYYVPEDKKADAGRSFEHTAEMVSFFEEYLGTKYPYGKYGQAVVEDFVYGGMENSSCTTLTADTLHDKRAHIDFTSDHLVSHELAHQWFGDLVTCRDWQHIWLNEGFATYCEALYWEKSRGNDEFQYYVMQMADDYFEEAGNRYARPIVTKVYKHPDDLFDRHTYEKGGCVLHMLRSQVGDKYFKRALRTYLQRFANSTTETDDLRKVFELESGKSLQQFFDQWLFRAGHPDLRVEFSLEGSVAKIKVEQAQADIFRFLLDVKVYSAGKEKTYSFDISEKQNAFQISADSIEWFSIDPEFKVLKRMGLKAPKEMLLKQLQKGKTVIERVEAARALRDNSSDEVVEALKKTVLEDKFWGVAVEAARSLGTMKTESAYDALKKCISVKHPKARRAVVRALGEFKRDSLELLKPVLKDESYFVTSEAATAIGKTKDRRAISVLKQAIEIPSFQNIVAQGAIAGLKEFEGDREIAELLLEKTKYGNYHRVREAATFALGKFVHENPSVVNQLKKLLTDKWFRVRINACRAFADAEELKAVPDLNWVAEHDLDHRVRRVAEECINLIKEATKKPKEVAEMREELDRVKSKSLEIMQKMDRLEREMR